MALGTRLRDLRGAKGWTLEDLENKTGLTGPYLSKIERDRALPSSDALDLIARELGVEAETHAELLEARERLSLSEQLGVDSSTAEVVVALMRLDRETRTELARVTEVLEDLDPGDRHRLVDALRGLRESLDVDQPELEAEHSVRHAH